MGTRIQLHSWIKNIFRCSIHYRSDHLTRKNIRSASFFLQTKRSCETYIDVGGHLLMIGFPGYELELHLLGLWE
jgi:hypothetical protein